jgi:hypothetical protein
MSDVQAVPLYKTKCNDLKRSRYSDKSSTE